MLTFPDWSRGAKIFQIWFLSIGTGVVNGTGLFLNPSHARMAKEIGTTITTLSRSTALIFLFLAIASVLSAPLARMYGKRPGMRNGFVPRLELRD